MTETIVPLEKPKRCRKSVKREKTGCITCKIRRVKCDEGKPTCQRCQKFGIKCDGYAQPRKIPSAVLHSRQALLPKPSIKILLPTFEFKNEVERKYFAQFQEKTAQEIAPYFDSETWRRLVLQTCHVPAIRHAIIAIGALDKTYMTSRTENDTNLDVSEDPDSPNVHRRIALDQYDKAIRSMREAVRHQKQDLRTTLITCLVTACFEAFHGNHPLANAQIKTGMSLIYEWKATFSNELPMGFKSPKPDVVEDDLVQTFGRLEVQTCDYVGMYSRPSATREREAALRAAGTNVLRNMPQEFESLQSARIYLELITRRLGDLWHICMGLFYPPDQKPVEGEDNDADFNDVFMRKETAIAELRLWYSSFEPMMKSGRVPETVGSLMLNMHFKVAVMTLETTLQTKFQDTPEMWDVVDLSRKILIALKSGLTPKFALDVGVVIPLYLVGIKCSATSVRREVIQLMKTYPRREGLWDSVVAGAVVEWILKVESVYEDRARGRIPDWARVHSVEMVADTWDRALSLWGYQQTSEEDRTMKKLETIVRHHVETRKRTSSWIDLTGSDDENSAPQPKQARVSSTQSASQPRPSQSLARDAWGDADEEDEILDLSQDADEGYGWVCVGAIDGRIVGIRHYSGFATMGEQVMVKREPGNPYDSNAIRINNVQGTQIGHLPRNLAAKLAPFMDSRTIVVEGVLAGEKGGWDCPINLKIYGPGEPIARAQLEAKLKSDRVPIRKLGIAAPKQPKQAIPPPQRKQMGYHSSQSSSQPSSSQAESLPELGIEHFVEHSERFRPRDVEKMVEEWGAGEDALSKMAFAEQPQDLVSTLLPYQRQGLAWLLEREHPVLPAAGSRDIVQLWKRSAERSNVFTNIATQFSTRTPPVLAKGGILADDMGLGKTLQVISLILEGGPGTTLIVAPVSVMSNWVQQIERHVKKERNMKVLTYHGSNRKRMTHREFGGYDVVVTSYGTLGTEYSSKGKNAEKIPRKDGLFCINWSRVVLDEGHNIRNHATKSAVAASSLLATARWVLTGTPIVNSIKDLYSMLKFLAVTGGLERMEIFNAILSRPLAAGDPRAEPILQSIMRTWSLRRKKDMKFIDLKLPELSEYVHRITFRKDEREKYDALQAEAKGMVKQFEAGKAKNGSEIYRHVLEILLRMRQVCCHWKLCGARVTDLVALLASDEVVALTKENRAALQLLLQLNIDSRDDCPICLEELHDPVITACKHVFGRDCIEKTIQLQKKCPMCRAELADIDCLVHPAVEEKAEEDPDLDIETKSSKTEALMSILTASRRDPKSKVVIFSQWTSFLNIIQRQLTEAGMKYARIDGSMSAQVRDSAMTALESDPDTRILLASLSVCSVGLNLVAADTVILADSWWAPAIEDQAVDRVHRLGQTRPCTVWRLIMEDSIEERVLMIQAEKRKLVGKAFQEKEKAAKEKTTRMGDILKLLS